MMSKKWYTIIGVIVAVILVMQLLPNKEKQSNEIAQLPQLNVKNDSEHAAIEKEQKLSILQKNMDNSLQLVITEMQSDLEQLAKEKQAKEATNIITRFQSEHPHYVYIRWENDKAKIQRGDIPSSEQSLANSYMKQADQLYVNGDLYDSDSFYGLDHEKYRVLGLIKDHTKVIAVVKESILPQVEQHQRNNLRLIPYPAEGQMKIESVKPNSTVDTTVIDGEDNGDASHYFKNEVVVQFMKEIDQPQLDKLKEEIHCEQVLQIGTTFIFKSNELSTEQLIAYFKENYELKFIEPHYLYMTNEETNVETIPNDVLFEKYQWNIPDIQAVTGWNISKGSEDVIIAVLDTGVQSDHPDLTNRLLEGYNVNDSSTNSNDDFGHGTHVAGIIGATVDNDEGVAGVSWYNKILPVKVLNSSGSGSTYSVAQGIIWATDHGAKVINMSLGNYASADFLHEAIQYAYNHDVVLVAASGNDNTSRPGYPAAYSEVFAVGATTNNRERASFSNYGDYIDVVAPGDSIASTYIGGQYASLSGTSMASPHVAALAGLIRTLNPSLTNVQVMEIMRQSATDLGDTGKDDYFGYGEIDVYRALTMAAGFEGTLQTYPQSVKNKLDKLINQ
ncbi:S8 family peptidase [Paenibacillus endoradicis]|uniref:S8 family peptidase n=1 Tax=Paenibacillus endoradicis TaxID=2972487 RepID=UPI002159928C|nr:S8 family peptidase [Paenibacillus endoradicis]MCR8659240.1 S8 family peptidase [Paenibacillus endoradicis]